MRDGSLENGVDRKGYDWLAALQANAPGEARDARDRQKPTTALRVTLDCMGVVQGWALTGQSSTMPTCLTTLDSNLYFALVHSSDPR